MASAEICAAGGRAGKGRVQSPEWVEKRLAAIRGSKRTPEQRERMSPHGMSPGKEQRRKLSQAMLTHIETVAADDCNCAAHRRFYQPTKLENILCDVILAEFPEVQREVLFGHFRVDAYIPQPYHLAFEADGEFWHRDSAKRDAARDAWLLRKFGLPVIRLTESELAECQR